MVPSLPLLSCELSVSVKENPDRKRKKKKKIGREIWHKKAFVFLLLFTIDGVFSYTTVEMDVKNELNVCNMFESQS